MKAIYLDNLAGHVEYAQLLHDGSEIHMSTDTNQKYQSQVNPTLMLTVPIQRPNVLVPVIELFLK